MKSRKTVKFTCRVFFLSVVYGLLSTAFFVDRSVAEDWKEEKGDHFIVYYVGEEKFAKDISRQAEVYYNQIANDLGYPRYSNFWQWDNRVKITIYATKEDYQKKTVQPEWSNGMADYVNKSIITYALSEGFMDGILPHEITHLVFRDFVGFTGQVPLWIDEGVAQWEEPKKRAKARPIAFYLIQNQSVIPLTDLTSMNNLTGKNENTVRAFYMQSVSLVDFLIKGYGPQSFTDFCRQLRDGKRLNEALSFSYSGSIKDIDELQAKWLKSIMDEYQPKES